MSKTRARLIIQLLNHELMHAHIGQGYGMEADLDAYIRLVSLKFRLNKYLEGKKS